MSDTFVVVKKAELTRFQNGATMEKKSMDEVEAETDDSLLYKHSPPQENGLKRSETA